MLAAAGITATLLAQLSMGASWRIGVDPAERPRWLPAARSRWSAIRSSPP
jgi:hypothetical protein